MRDLFDEFMDELRRKQAELEGRRPDAPKRPTGDDDGGDHDGRDEADTDAASDDEPAGPPDEAADEDEPIPLDDQPRPARPTSIGGRPPRRPRTRRGGEAGPPSARRIVGWTIAIALVFGVLLLVGPGIDFITDAMWYRSVGYESVFWTRIGTEAWLFIGVFLIALVVLLVDLWLAGRLAPPPAHDGTPIRGLFERLAEAARESQERSMAGRGGPFRGPPGRPAGEVVFDAEDLPDLTPIARVLLVILAVILALGLAGAAASAWETFLLWRNQVPFAVDGAPVTDPVFGRDVSFFLFELPLLRLVQSLANGLIIGALVIAGARYLVGSMRGGFSFTTPVRLHIGVLGALYLVSVAAGYQLDKYELVYSGGGVATGVSYADQAARFFAFDVLTIISALAAALLVGGAFTQLLWPLGGAIVVWFVASIALGTVYPEVVQRFVVNPDPFSREEPYIRNNIAMTRLAFGIDDWAGRDYRGDAVLTEEAIRLEQETFQNARLWDYRPLGTTIDQLQTFRRYYDFVDVDTDRYLVGDETRQVMLSARELDLEGSGIVENWLNTKIIYTHGMGLVMVPVNEVAGQGQPRLWIRDLPPVSSSGAPEIDQARVYFGEVSSDYVILGARQAEFDFPSNLSGPATDPSADTGAEYRWTGTSGIRLDNTLARLLFAARFRDLNLLISDQVTDQSQLVFHRSLADRLPRLAPFLRYDKDPYLVVTGDGGLVYVQDAYTTSDRFPHAQHFFPTLQLEATNLGADAVNYIRNSVKVVVDAYDGTTTFYVADSSDPLVRAYQGVFPDLFRPLDQLPTDLRGHVRYPEELFNVQARTFGRYHVTDPATFFRGDDVWQVPSGQGSEQSLPAEAYYVIMRMPGETEAEFLLLQPMVPTARPNMISWVAARMDGDRYGQVRYFQFPANTTVFGPQQVEALISQDPLISAQITLWNQSGSTVVRGNLLVVPIQDAIVYLQPIYLQSTASSFPEFQRIVVASPTSVVWAESLGQALDLLLVADGGAPSPTPSPTPTGTPTPTPSAGPTPSAPAGDVQGLIEYANLHFELAQQALRNGDFATYGEEIALVEAALQQLSELVGSPSPSP
jgi:hypothetical protein